MSNSRSDLEFRFKALLNKGGRGGMELLRRESMVLGKLSGPSPA